MAIIERTFTLSTKTPNLGSFESSKNTSSGRVEYEFFPNGSLFTVITDIFPLNDSHQAEDLRSLRWKMSRRETPNITLAVNRNTRRILLSAFSLPYGYRGKGAFSYFSYGDEDQRCMDMSASGLNVEDSSSSEYSTDFAITNALIGFAFGLEKAAIQEDIQASCSSCGEVDSGKLTLLTGIDTF